MCGAHSPRASERGAMVDRGVDQQAKCVSDVCVGRVCVGRDSCVSGMREFNSSGALDQRLETRPFHILSDPETDVKREFRMDSCSWSSTTLDCPQVRHSIVSSSQATRAPYRLLYTPPQLCTRDTVRARPLAPRRALFRDVRFGNSLPPTGDRATGRRHGADTAGTEESQPKPGVHERRVWPQQRQSASAPRPRSRAMWPRALPYLESVGI